MDECCNSKHSWIEGANIQVIASPLNNEASQLGDGCVCTAFHAWVSEFTGKAHTEHFEIAACELRGMD